MFSPTFENRLALNQITNEKQKKKKNEIKSK